MPNTDYTGKQKAAMLLITLGPERSGQIFKFLKEEEIEELTLEIANMQVVLPEVKEEVLEEFFELSLAQNYITEGGINYAHELLKNALGEKEADELISRLMSSLQVRPFDFARKTEPSQLLNFIQNEHPQTISLILAYLKPGQAAAVLSELPQEQQADVARRIAQMDRTSPEIVRDVEKILEKKIAAIATDDYTSVGGVDSIVEILNTVDRGTEKNIMETLEVDDTELAEEIRKKMFVFEDILGLDDRAIQKILKDVDNKDLAIALKGSNEEVKNMIFKNLSTRLVDMIKEDIEFMGPIRVKEVEDAQQKIVNIVRKLEESGEIVTSRGGGDELIV